jgi:uncharacterized protein (DUF608 family)
LLFADRAAVAGPFEEADFDKLVPADKKLRPEWLRSLIERGEPTAYRGEELRFIGMPVGGIGAGQLYLGGDGKLWHWDVFNTPQPGNFTNASGPNYAHPPMSASPLDQGFVLRVSAGGKTLVRTLDRRGFSDITFRGQYPIANVQYHDPELPVTAALEAFSPFIPLNADDSSLPATVLHYTVKNTSDGPVRLELAGWLENAVCLGSARNAAGRRRNRIVRERDLTIVHCTAETIPDKEAAARLPLEKQADFGSLALALLGSIDGAFAKASVPLGGTAANAIFQVDRKNAETDAVEPFGRRLVGSVGRTITLKPGETADFTFAVAWFFPGLPPGQFSNLAGSRELRRSYAARFESAASVARYLASHFDRLAGQTRLWNKTWYDSTLPYWFLDRTLLTICCLATATAYRFTNGRFYGFEGTYCCDGTCTHVWHYAQAVARLFPHLERATREMVDFGLAFHADNGAMDYRGEYGRQVAVDGQAGTILRAYREHQMSVDDAFLHRTWPKIKKAIEHLIVRDPDEDGLLDGEQYNTLDASWYGHIPWTSSLYLACLRAGAAMAVEMSDEAFVKRCTTIAERGGRRIVERLFGGEHFIQVLDPGHARAINTNDGCHIDQVFGQSWAFQVGLPRALPEVQTKAALEALWKYNFTPDVGPYRRDFKTIPGGRWYAMPGEGGLLMCTWPKGGAEKAKGQGADPGFVGYFNECMTGFEYQAAAHMIAEGLVEKGLAVTRMIHDRYHARKRNPYNEVECSDHYARSMASYGVFLAACGFTYHGPKGDVGFAPRLTPADFRAAFTAAEGWGTFSQQHRQNGQNATIALEWGKLKLLTLGLTVPQHPTRRIVNVAINGRPVEIKPAWDGDRVQIALAAEAVLQAGDRVEVTIG